MLTKEFHKAITEFRQSLERLQKTMVSDQSDVNQMTEAFGEVQRVFESRIMQLGDSDSLAQLQSYITETHKQMRLLGLDLRFLKASRHSATTRERLASMRDRISIVIGYSTVVLDKTTD
ncbi:MULTISPECIES: heterocyst frequency control protein PatD [Arthrospira]|jgi:uncharacterized coiled-coil protein SlyX|uniref:Heterocyst frequency control protein PatD n=1 Tax=Limnospira platensis NIES-46 TaxID=1236695 RepID=A0A5M3T2Z3_LIMPL|nr:MULTISPECIES: heterocyst frequency control protein PatD [Arthrospira]AMW27885.1 hypothetical protein AP285_07715 [Arthrospira platensis YZ]KDR54379.1 hypothetical protein APPUASWS_028045 [Arthrospira platensis str. Paraca]MBD2669383.1 heterocyst frequency control protein PatD [Arthrospira platensis FACHB-439]MBD2711011.1 heterocyst frequency control protein PatD [Arthrospira platensis FACHB-835]MDF2210801.1 heterocyst frequency control protein PatD [Arthrospira platensis NCB002]MDT9183198.